MAVLQSFLFCWGLTCRLLRWGIKCAIVAVAQADLKNAYSRPQTQPWSRFPPTNPGSLHNRICSKLVVFWIERLDNVVH